MERDSDLITAILEWLAGRPEPWTNQPLTVSGYRDQSIVAYHFDLCEQAGFIQRASDRIQLTWSGHEELERQRANSGSRPRTFDRHNFAKAR